MVTKNGLGEVLDAYNKYSKATKNRIKLKNAIGAHIAAALPKGLVLEWSQSSSVLVTADKDEDGGYYLDDGLALYKGTAVIPGLTKAGLGTLMRTWKALPSELLQIAFGTAATVRILSTGKVKVQQ